MKNCWLLTAAEGILNDEFFKSVQKQLAIKNILKKHFISYTNQFSLQLKFT